MPQAILLPSATADLVAIWEFIAEDSPRSARQLIERIIVVCDTTLADNPRIGRSRQELASELRSFPLQDYTIFYRPVDEGVEIVRVLHGNRDIESLFDT